MTTKLDRRLHAYRPDLADEKLRGRVNAERFVDGRLARIAIPVVGLRPSPDPARGIDTQLLLGEIVRVFDCAAGWAWVQAVQDGYVGYIPDNCMAETESHTHVVCAPRTFVYPEPELRAATTTAFSMGSRINVVREMETRGTRYLILADGRALFSGHCKQVNEGAANDYVTVAARFLETPYLWGGRSGFGIDCSALVQLSLMMAGQSVPRDTDMQATVGREITQEDLRRGDLVFWKGHVGIMEDRQTLLHANGHTMTVARENLEAAVKRIGWLYGQPTGFRRLG